MEESMMSSEEQDFMISDEESDTSESGYEDCYESTVPVPAQTIKLITEASLLSEQEQDLRRVIDILQVNEKQARSLLIHYRWNTERLVNAFVERGSDWLFSQSGIASRLESTNSVVTTCNVCTDDGLKEENTTTMDCAHTFCNECWTQHFLVKINEGQSKRIECMAAECNIICDEDVVRNLVTAKDPEAAQRFDRFLLESYIEDNYNVKWCPRVPTCGNAVRVEEDINCEIQCSCGQQFCFNCLAEPHSPCSCLIWQLWEKKCKDDSETLNWIAVNTKICPKCGKNVHKDGGCNLVRCLCGQYFCWLCGGATGHQHTWNNIVEHPCGRYKEDQEEEIGKSERDLKRYTHYYSRWQAHKDSLKLEEKQKKILEEKILYLESKRSHVEDYSWLTNALQRLFRSRCALSYSYPFAFHMFGDELLKDKITATEKELKQVLFEEQQQQLERVVERLSKIIEGPFDEQHAMAVRVQVIDLAVLADTWCRKMYECIQNDLLSLLVPTPHLVAPYNSNGVQRISET